ncbi:hypothetical protein [Akkermansia muciniphila]
MEPTPKPIKNKLIFYPDKSIRENIENQIPADDEESLEIREAMIEAFEENQAMIRKHVKNLEFKSN